MRKYPKDIVAGDQVILFGVVETITSRIPRNPLDDLVQIKEDGTKIYAQRFNLANGETLAVSDDIDIDVYRGL